MAETDLVDRLAEHKTLGAAPREELAWLAAHGVLRQLEDGDVMVAAGAPVDGLFILLSGHVAIFVDRGAGRHKVMEWRAGDVTGVLPYSRLVNSPGDSVAQEPTEILVVHSRPPSRADPRLPSRSPRSSCTRCSTAPGSSPRATCTTRR